MRTRSLVSIRNLRQGLFLGYLTLATIGLTATAMADDPPPHVEAIDCLQIQAIRVMDFAEWPSDVRPGEPPCDSFGLRCPRVRISPDGRWVLTRHRAVRVSDGTEEPFTINQVTDLRTGHHRLFDSAPMSTGAYALFVGQGQWIAFPSLDGVYRLFDVETGVTTDPPKLAWFFHPLSHHSWLDAPNRLIIEVDPGDPADGSNIPPKEYWGTFSDLVILDIETGVTWRIPRSEYRLDYSQAELCSNEERLLLAGKKIDEKGNLAYPTEGSRDWLGEIQIWHLADGGGKPVLERRLDTHSLMRSTQEPYIAGTDAFCFLDGRTTLKRVSYETGETQWESDISSSESWAGCNRELHFTVIDNGYVDEIGRFAWFEYFDCPPEDSTASDPEEWRQGIVLRSCDAHTGGDIAEIAATSVFSGWAGPPVRIDGEWILLTKTAKSDENIVFTPIRLRDLKVGLPFKAPAGNYGIAGDVIAIANENALLLVDLAKVIRFPE